MEGKREIIVIGGGPAGMMAAGTAASRGNEVMLIEKNEKLGKKIFISGKGRCNVANDSDIEGLIENIPTNGTFLRQAFEQLDSKKLIAFFNKMGLKTKTERGNRIFPESDKSSDVIQALKSYLVKNQVQIVNGEVQDVVYENKCFTHVVLKTGKKVYADNVIIATGGLSYPSTGSTGDGYRFARSAGHTIIEPVPSLVPLTVRERWVSKVVGLNLKNIGIQILDSNGAIKYQDFGELVFMHYGVSGPVILSASAYIKDIGKQAYTLLIDLKPALDQEKLEARILRDIGADLNAPYSEMLKKLLPSKMIPVIVDRTGIPSYQQAKDFTPENTQALVSSLKALKLKITGFRPIEEAIVTSGGVKVDEINPKTMESKLVQGLFFAGEVIDVDAYTGGFNLQIAFSTGYAAGMNC